MPFPDITPLSGWDYRYPGYWYDERGVYVGWARHEDDGKAHTTQPPAGWKAPDGGFVTGPPVRHAVATPLNGNALTEVHVHARGSIYKKDLAKLGFADMSRNYSPHLVGLTISESAAEAAQVMVADFMDDARPDKPSGLTPLTIGSEMHVYGYKLNYFMGGGRGASPERLFRGLCYKTDTQTSGTERTRSFIAYDDATYLARTEAPRVYIDKSFVYIFKDICRAFGFKANVGVVDTRVKLGKIIMGPGWSLWRLIQECQKRHYDKTGLTLFVRGSGRDRQLDLLSFGHWRGEGTGITWRIMDGKTGSLISHSTSETFEEGATRVIMIQEEYDDAGEFKSNKILLEKVITGPLRDTFGDLVKIISPNSSLTPLYDENSSLPEWGKIDSAMKQQMRQEAANVGRTHRTATMTNVYIPGIRRGDRIDAGPHGNVMESGWIVDGVSTTWGPAGATQTLDVVKHQADSSIGVGV